MSTGLRHAAGRITDETLTDPGHLVIRPIAYPNRD